MKEERLKQMEELDARIEKTNYDLAGLESRKKEMEDSKFAKQEEIKKLEKEKNSILNKTDRMNRIQRIFYIAFALKNDLKQIDLLNVKITEYQKEKDNIQNKIDIQNELYAETIKEKDKYIEQRKELYNESANKQQEKSKNNTHIQDLVEIHRITEKYKESEIMKKVKQTIEKSINEMLGERPKEEKRRQTEECEMG